MNSLADKFIRVTLLCAGVLMLSQLLWFVPGMENYAQTGFLLSVGVGCFGVFAYTLLHWALDTGVSFAKRVLLGLLLFAGLVALIKLFALALQPILSM